MKIRRRLLAGATAFVLVHLVMELQAERGRRRDVDRRLSDLVRTHAIDAARGGATRALQRSADRDRDRGVQRAGRDRRGARVAADRDRRSRRHAHRRGRRRNRRHRGGGGALGHVAVRHEINRGQGDALRTGFALAIERKAAIIVTMDADGQHRPEELPNLLEPVIAGAADYVQGSRYLGHYKDAGDARDLGIRGFTMLINLVSGAGITDCTNGFRAIRGDALPGSGWRSHVLGLRADHGVGEPGPADPRGLRPRPVADPW